ncbi:hypothetical protein SLS60_009539 [Paraconiothyrium brasiliense]|uniref:Uncharacterized protein n=1 Tax=Paraconiothyrium brasiliense TaxID=300254 RepID=A0ABR3QUL1_9PLEO
MEQITPAADTATPKLRRKRKIENLHLESVIDAELTQIDRVTGNVVAIPLGRARALSAPMIIVTPPSPEKVDPLEKAGSQLARINMIETLSRYTSSTPVEHGSGESQSLNFNRSLSLGDLTWIATATGRALLSIIPYWRTPAEESHEPSEESSDLDEQFLPGDFLFD